MKFNNILLSALIALASLNMVAAHAETVEISGSTTVNSLLITPYKAEIERQSGTTLKINPSSSGKGLTDLIGFNTDIAMSSAPIKDLVDQIGKTPNFRGLVLKESELKIIPLGRAQVLFIVHPSNSLKTLKRAQLEGLLTGKITNWSEVGGANQPVVVISESPLGAMHTEIVQKVLGGKSFSSNTKLMEVATDVPKQVAMTPGSIGFVSSVLPAADRGEVNLIGHEGRIEQTLFIITRPGANETLDKVVGAIKAVGLKVLARY
jgi:phosphate transport system substrate-binding protein